MSDEPTNKAEVTVISRAVGRDIVNAPPTEDPRDAQIAELQDQIVEEKDRHNEERVIWYLGGCVATLAILIASGASTISIVLLALFMFILLIVLAKRWGVEWVSMAVDYVLEFQSRTPKGD